jgi:FlaA1/EpsC-like NDP-sugar epimerase
MNEYMDYMKRKPEMIYRIIDVRDREMLERAFEKYRPDIVFHAAAHKHVPLMEFNEVEALRNNVMGTRNVLEAAARSGAEHFILVSTDKAVRPSNVMGATKRLAELVTCYYHEHKKLNTAIVRFGNVIGSRGSVIPLFREQIERGGPVTVTHPEVTRYFMSIPEAALLVINAAAFSRGGEIFVLDMGGQYRMDTIARRLIEMYGLIPDVDIKIEYTGLRPGEKLYEELFHDDGRLSATANRKILVKMSRNGLPPERMERFLQEEVDALCSLTSGQARDLLKELVTDYSGSPVPEKGEDAGKFIS